MQAILKSTDSWDTCWTENVTPWDLGRITPIIHELLSKNDLPIGRALVPGCGSSYDAVALASPVRHVVGIDISAAAIERARQAVTKPKANWVDFVCADFFTYNPASPFNLIFDYTFFCAVDPSLRSLWASKMAELLAPDGELITLVFPADDHEGGPPYAVSLAEYEKVLHPHGFRTTYYEENHLAVDGRKGREFLGRWRRMLAKV